jgi:hypothetical protein
MSIRAAFFPTGAKSAHVVSKAYSEIPNRDSAQGRAVIYRPPPSDFEQLQLQALTAERRKQRRARALPSRSAPHVPSRSRRCRNARRLRPNWFALNLSNILMLQRRDCSRGNFFAPFLHEMSGINEFERLRTAAYVTAKRAHDRRSEDRISHADRHDARSFLRPR